MRGHETERRSNTVLKGCSVMFGGMLALGISAIVLAMCAVVISAGILGMDASCRVAAVACLAGSFFGGFVACSRWNAKRLFGGLLTGVCAFVLIALVSLMSGNGEFGAQALIEFLACVIGGGLAGFLSAGRKKSRKKVRK